MSLPSPIEIRHDIASSAAFRLTLRFAAVFVLCLLVLNLALGAATRWYVERSARDAVMELSAEIRAAFDHGGASAIADFAAAEAAEFADDGLLFGHQSADGVLLAGNLAISEPAIGWITFTPEGIDEDEALWLRSVRLRDGSWLNVAAESEIYHDIGELMLAGAVWTVAIALPLALLSGALLSRAVLARLAPIAETADGVREGALSRRAPLAGTGDEFDGLAGNINAMLERIETLTRNLRNVSVGIAHDLRTPLARIRNRLVELRDGTLDEAEKDRASAGALAQIDAVLTTFDALLKIGQIEADAQRKGFEMMKLSDLIEELAEIYEPVAAEQGKRLAARLGTEVELFGNRALLAQMISNLLENAIEHTPEGTTIIMSLDSEGPERRLVIEDDGPGIPADQSGRVFERFYRPEHSRNTAGNGLGLSLVKSICSLHGFGLNLADAGPGARFEITV
ncbi:MAG: HAMP domain-containing histidine kinase [Paracoccaceae bacterium]|nr:HAMP domain-containing histidine kinase [Paracoccaceae bacterium]